MDEKKAREGLEKLEKWRKNPDRVVELVETSLVNFYEPELNRILCTIGHPEALITDRSSFKDFAIFPDERQDLIDSLVIQFKIKPVDINELLVSYAARIKKPC